MWSVIVEAQLVVDDAVIDVIRFEEVLQCPRSLLRLLFDLVDLRLRKSDGGADAEGLQKLEHGDELQTLSTERNKRERKF